MKKLIVKYHENEKDCFVNITAERITERDGIIFAYSGERLVGVFDMGFINAAYLSEGGGER